MGFIIFVVIVSIIGLCAIGWLGFFLFVYTERTQKKAEANAETIMDIAFNGDDDVVFKINMESPKYETVVLGAKKRGYKLAHENNDTSKGTAKTLIFAWDGQD